MSVARHGPEHPTPNTALIVNTSDVSPAGGGITDVDFNTTISVGFTVTLARLAAAFHATMVPVPHGMCALDSSP